MASDEAREIDRAVMVLERASDALSAADIGRLLANEPELALVADQLSSIARDGSARLDPVIAPALIRARGVLARCRRLGANLNDGASISLAVCGRSLPVYGRNASLMDRRPSPRSIDERV